MAEANKEAGPLETLLAVAQRAGVTEFWNDAEFWRDALWLAQYVPEGTGEDRRQRPFQTTPPPTTTPGPIPGATTTPPPVTTPPPKTEQGPGDGAAPGQLYPQFDAGKVGGKATTIYVPASGALPQPLELARAMRPYQQKFRSRRLTKLDIDATVELSAERREMTPVLTREKERWFSLALLVDDAPSMAVWRKTAREFARFLGMLGVFRDVRIWFADEDLRLTSSGGREAKAKQLVDPAGRTLIVALTNGVGLHWRSRELAEWLTDWARTGPVSICSLLPPMRWQFTDVGPAYLWARASVPGVGNRLLAAGEGPDRVAMKAGSTVFPIFPLTKQGLEDWAAMQMSRRETKTAAIAISPEWFDAWKDVEEAPQEARDAARRMAEFRSFASREASKLLEYFSAIPLYLPVMRLVQATMLPESPLSAMAEVLMSGLVIPAKLAQGTAKTMDAAPLLFEFTKDAREYLRDRTSVADLERIHREVRGAIQEYIERRAGKSLLDFEALVEDPEGLKDLPEDARHFVEVTAETMRALGYTKRRKPPAPQPAEAPGVYVLWDLPEVEEFSQEIIAGLKERGLRVMEARNEAPPAEGCFLHISNTMEETLSEFTEAFAHVLESGFDGVELLSPGVTGLDEEYVYADAYPGRKELLDALVEGFGKLDVVPPAAPKGAPRVERGTKLEGTLDTDELLSGAAGVLFSNEAFDPYPYLTVFSWFRQERLKFKGGIQWLRRGETPENHSDQLLIYDRPNDVVTIPAGCKAVLVNPANFALFGLPDNSAAYEGPEEAIAPIAEGHSQAIRGVYPDDVLEAIRHSPHLLGMAAQMTSDQSVWPLVHERFADEWRLRDGGAGTLAALAVRLLVSAFDALPPQWLNAAGFAATLRDGATEDLTKQLVPPDTWEWLQKNMFTRAPGYVPTNVCLQVAYLSRHWARWNLEILQSTGFYSRTWLEAASADSYLRRHAIEHLAAADDFLMIENMVTDFRWWRLRIESDGVGALAQDIRYVSETREDLLQLRVFLDGLWKDSALSASDVAQAISQYNLPLPERLRQTVGGAVASTGAPPAHFILLASSRPGSGDAVDERALWAAEAIGVEIALHNCGLICGAEKGGDETAARAFIKQRTSMQLPAAPALRIVTYSERELPLDLESSTKVVRGENQVMDSVQLADTVVLVGGNNYVARIARAAAAAGKPVYAVPGAGGSAAGVFEAFMKAAGLEARPAWAAEIDSADAAVRVADALLDAIKEGFHTPSEAPAASPDLESARAAMREGRASIYVNVVGTGAHQLDTLVQVAAEEMGRSLAEAGFGLITGAWPGVDYVAASAYLKSGGKWLAHVTGPYSSDRFPEALAIEERATDWAQRLSDGVVLIGGAGATLSIFEAARRLEKPVFPYGRSGGDAKAAVERLDPAGNGVLLQDLSPREFAAYVVRRLSGGEMRLWELATQYDSIRQTMGSGPGRTAQMTAIFEQMLKEADGQSGELSELQASASAGRRLAAIAILIKKPRKEELNWLAERLENPRVEAPFVGFQASNALYAAVQAMSGEDLGLVEQALDKARGLGEQLTTDPGRLRVITMAQRDLFRKRASEEAPDVSRLVEQELVERQQAQHVITHHLLIFRTAEQRTWVSFTTAGVACVLDNRPRGEDYIAVQWFQRLDDVTPDSVRVSSRSGTLTIGGRRNWLYSGELFKPDRLRELVLAELKRAAEFRDRMRELELL